ncbi:MAG: LLM class flavin-dependent oxidoreductase [Candidatus Heimdallarchaeota archaeon]
MTKDQASFDGVFYNFSGVELSPKLVQAQLPIYIGGNALNNIKRAAKYGIGWFPAGLTPHELKNAIFQLKKYSDKYEREYSKIDIAPQLAVCIAKTHEETIQKYKNSQIYAHDLSIKNSTLKRQNVENLEERDLIGTVNEIISKIEEYHVVGVDHLPALIFVGNAIEAVSEDMRLFAEEIIPSFS